MVLNKRKYKSISTVVNLDMVGRMDPDLQKLKCMHSFNKTNVLDRINTADFSLKLNAVGPEKLLFLDTKYFYEAGIPCMSFTTGIHNDYHATTDDAQYISYDGMVKINAFIKAVLRQL